MNSHKIVKKEVKDFLVRDYYFFKSESIDLGSKNDYKFGIKKLARSIRDSIVHVKSMSVVCQIS